MFSISPSHPAIVAHRGDHSHYAENSLAAFKAACNLAIAYPDQPFFIETDIRATKDGALVLMHDDDVTRTTMGQGSIEQMTLHQARDLTMRHQHQATISPATDYHYAIAPEDERVATLSELLALVQETNQYRSIPMGLALEVKHAARDNHNWLARMTSRIQEWLPVPQHTSPSVAPLASLLNNNADLIYDMPTLVFSSAGIAGKHDMQALWSMLNDDAKHAVAHIPTMAPAHHDYSLGDRINMHHAAPHPLHIAMVREDSPLLASLQQAGIESERFWEIGLLGQHLSSNATLLTIESIHDMRDAQAHGSNLITTDHPDLLLQALDTGQVAGFAEREQARRQPIVSERML